MIKHLTKSDFDSEIKNAKLAVVDFWASWCGPCKMLAPVLEQVDTAVTDCLIAKVNVDEQQELAMRYNVMSIPTIIFFKNNKEVDKLVGLVGKEKIIGLIEKYKKD